MPPMGGSLATMLKWNQVRAFGQQSTYLIKDCFPKAKYHFKYVECKYDVNSDKSLPKGLLSETDSCQTTREMLLDKSQQPKTAVQ